jgi:xanthine dehydrogenase accessory factor
MADFLDQIEQLRPHERRVAMATLLAARGGSPRPVGAKLFVGEGGRLLGSVSIGGCVDARVVEHGDRLLRENRAERVTVSVDDVEALELGLACGAEFDLLVEPVILADDDPVVAVYAEGARRSRAGRESFIATTLMDGAVRRQLLDNAEGAPAAAFVERLAPAPVLVIVGASDVAVALGRLARMLGMRVVVAEGRERYAAVDRFPSGTEVQVGMPSELVRPWLAEGASVVLTSHDYRYELPVLRDALRAPVRFIGMLAGRKRADAVRSLLRDEGFTDAELSRLHSPIGLDIGGREPEEIALSIAAQLVAVREDKPIARR